jgi:dihydropteroate synthase
MTKIPLSVDTVSSMVAKKALDLGASVINDVSGLRADSKMAKLVADRAVPVILMANCGNPCASYQASIDSLRNSFSIALEAGIESSMILVDPGIGFGKQSEVDYEILRNLHAFTALHRPVLVGVSRKAFIGNQLGQPDPSDRLLGSIAATSVAVYNGANVIRTHDVKETRIAVVIGEAIRRNARGDRRNQVEDSQ